MTTCRICNCPEAADRELGWIEFDEAAEAAGFRSGPYCPACAATRLRTSTTTGRGPPDPPTTKSAPVSPCAGSRGKVCTYRECTEMHDTDIAPGAGRGNPTALLLAEAA